jgi:hypothetical protein
MFDFVKKGLDAIAPPEPVFDDEIFEEQDVDSDTTLQYAHLFQELAELTPEGSADNLVRNSIVDIPLDDDIELNNIEFNIGDGRVTDVPADATLQEAFYDELKSFDDFYQEAADTTPMFIRETANSHARRVSMKQEELYKVYQESMEKKGLFGFGMIKLSDDRVPQSVMFDFGPYSKSNDKHYVTKLECFFETDKKHRINKKQLEAVNAFRDASYEGITELLKSIVGKDYPKEAKKFETKSIWDSLTPTKLYVPKDLSDEYKVSQMIRSISLGNGPCPIRRRLRSLTILATSLHTTTTRPGSRPSRNLMCRHPDQVALEKRMNTIRKQSISATLHKHPLLLLKLERPSMLVQTMLP